MSGARVGAIADDFTGAVDLAATLRGRGYRTRVLLGVPEPGQLTTNGIDAVVIGLKTRSALKSSAIRESGSALRSLREVGVRRFFFKICASFDSTAEGNIGPVLDMMMSDLNVEQCALVLPFPEIGRTVFDGHIYLNMVPLDQTSMRFHPLTPMTDSFVPRLLAAQTHRKVHQIRLEDVAQGARHISRRLLELGPGIAIFDAIQRRHLDCVATALESATLVAGGSGLAASAPIIREGQQTREDHCLDGRFLIVAGSASHATQRQVAVGRRVLPSRKLNVEAARQDGTLEADGIARWMRSQWSDAHEPVMVYSAENDADLRRPASRTGQTSSSVETTMGAVAVQAVAAGARNIVVAGGETSGTVITALGITALDVSEPLSPGVAWATGLTSQGHRVRVLLKPGNLGEDDLFLSAWRKR